MAVSSTRAPVAGALLVLVLIILGALVGVFLFRGGEAAVIVLDGTVVEASGPEPSHPVLPPEVGQAGDPGIAVREAMQAAAATSQVHDLVVVRGVVLDSKGQPIRGAWVRVPSELPESVWTDQEGRFELEPLQSGSHELQAGAVLFHACTHQLELDGSSAEVELDLRLEEEPRVVVRVLMPDGTPLTKLEIPGTRLGRKVKLLPVATREDPGATFPGIKGSSNNPHGIGSYWRLSRANLHELYPDAIGLVTLHEDPPGWLSLVILDQVVAKQAIDLETEIVTFRLDPAMVGGLTSTLLARVVSDEDGEPLAARASLSTGFNIMGGQSFELADGRLRVDRCPVGAVTLRVVAPGFVTKQLELAMEPGDARDLGELRMVRPVRIDGVVLDEAGLPVEVRLRYGRRDAEGDFRWITSPSTYSDELGRFSISGIEPDLWHVQVLGVPATPPKPYEPSLRSLPVEVDARAGSVSGLELRVEAPMELRLTTPTYATDFPVARAFDERGLPVDRAYLGDLDPISILRLHPGRYRLEVRRGEQLLEERIVLIGAEPVELDLLLTD